MMLLEVVQNSEYKIFLCCITTYLVEAREKLRAAPPELHKEERLKVSLSVSCS